MFSVQCSVSKASVAKEVLSFDVWTLDLERWLLLRLIHKNFSCRDAVKGDLVNLLKVSSNEGKLIAILEVCSTSLNNEVSRAGNLCNIEIRR
jgi:hypothetical protein